MEGFYDELEKIAASSCKARHPKTRQGRRSIRAHNLLKNAQAPTLLSQIGSLAAKRKKELALLGAGAGAAIGGEKLVAEPLALGYQVRRSMQR